MDGQTQDSIMWGNNLYNAIDSGIFTRLSCVSPFVSFHK